MHRDEPGREPVVITDAAPSFAEEQRGRRHRYALLMSVHIAGFALAGALYYVAWWLGLVIMLVTGVLPWIAVVAANDTSRRDRRTRAARDRDRSSRRALDSHITIDPTR